MSSAPSLNLPENVLKSFTNDELASIARESYRYSSNEAEHLEHLRLNAEGATVIRRGWPDFLVLKDGKAFVQEVKAGTDEVRPTQLLVMRVLAGYGIGTQIARYRGQGAWTYTCPTCPKCGGSGRVEGVDPMLNT